MRLIKVVNNERESIVMGRYSNNKYCKTYHKGDIVEADKDTIGIFCFETEEDAINWLDSMYEINYQLLEVKPLTRPKRKVPKISFVISETGIYEYYHFKKVFYATSAPKGTVLVKRLQVMN